MFDHSNTVPFHSLNKITDALDGIQLGDTPNAVQASALKLLADSVSPRVRSRQFRPCTNLAQKKE